MHIASDWYSVPVKAWARWTFPARRPRDPFPHKLIVLRVRTQNISSNVAGTPQRCRFKYRAKAGGRWTFYWEQPGWTPSPPRYSYKVSTVVEIPQHLISYSTYCLHPRRQSLFIPVVHRACLTPLVPSTPAVLIAFHSRDQVYQPC